MLLASLIVVAGRVPAARLRCAAGLAALLIMSFVPATNVLAFSKPWHPLGTLGGLGWAMALFALLLLEDGLAQGVTNCNASAAKPKAKVRA
jgi:hypothetical protein